MEDKVAIGLLKRLLDKYPLDGDEKEAVRTAIGILAWSKLIEGHVKGIKKARDRNISRED
ncbi:MAG: hypothetical protein Q7S75_01345 [bacterium]|nr:hypothetical protein [bacterium]